MMLAVRWQAQSNQFFQATRKKVSGHAFRAGGEVGEGFASKKQRITHDKPRPFVTLDLAVALPLGNWLFI